MNELYLILLFCYVLTVVYAFFTMVEYSKLTTKLNQTLFFFLVSIPVANIFVIYENIKMINEIHKEDKEAENEIQKTI